MTCKDLIDYLSRFDASEAVAVLVVDPADRLHYKIGAYQFIDKAPVLMFEVVGSELLDEVAGEESE